MNRVAATVLLLALLGVAACGEDAPPAPVPPPWVKVAPEQIAEAKKHGVPVAFENDIGMRFVLIPAGTFLMGWRGAGRRATRITRYVRISKPFYVQVTELTNKQYRRFRSDHDSGRIKGERIDGDGEEVVSLDGDEQPVVQVSWEDAVAFAEWLRRHDGARAYRLPTEAEWEYACRAGTETAFSFGEKLSTDQANYGRKGLYLPDDGLLTLDVGIFLHNGWGLHDMHGNVREWCLDAFEEYPFATQELVDPVGPSAAHHDRVQRGGAWTNRGASGLTSVRRSMDLRDSRASDCGFRLVSPLPEPSK